MEPNENIDISMDSDVYTQLPDYDDMVIINGNKNAFYESINLPGSYKNGVINFMKLAQNGEFISNYVLLKMMNGNLLIRQS